jgi:hypothetical protein
MGFASQRSMKRRIWVNLDLVAGCIHPEAPKTGRKRWYVERLGFDLCHIGLFGNGRNDRMWLKAVKQARGLSVAVDVGEGCAIEAMLNANVFISGVTNALDLLLDKERVIGTLRTKGDE